MLDVLVVDDDEIIRTSVADALAAAGHSVVQATDGEHALSCFATQAFDLAICDVQMPKLDGLTLFRRLRRESPGTAVVLMTTYGTIPDAVGTLRDGALDYVTKPFDPETFVSEVVQPLDERRAHIKRFEQARARFIERETGAELVGSSMAMRQLATTISHVARGGSAVAIWGEPGTGKKLVARTIHARSARREGPFLVVPCTSLPGLMRQTSGPGTTEVTDSRLQDARDDWFWAAEGGTLVLEGVDTLPISAQSGLLRLLLRAGGEPRPRVVRRGGDWKPRGVRLLCIARENPVKWVAERGFLEPLFFRLATMQIRTPALAEREGDLYMLVCHFLRELTPATRTVPGLTPAAWKALFAHTFTSNLRELSWTLEHALAAAHGADVGRGAIGGGEIDVQHLPESFGAFAP